MEDAIIEARRAHTALLRSRSQTLAQRDALNTQLARIDAALEALGELIGTAPEPPAPPEPPASPQPAAPSQADVAVENTEGSRPEPLQALSKAIMAAPTAKPINRKARLREIMLEEPEAWFTAFEMASRLEGEAPSATRRTATYEMMRRMAKQGELEVDNSSQTTKFRARPAAIREQLLARDIELDNVLDLAHNGRSLLPVCRIALEAIAAVKRPHRFF